MYEGVSYRGRVKKYSIAYFCFFGGGEAVMRVFETWFAIDQAIFVGSFLDIHEEMLLWF